LRGLLGKHLVNRDDPVIVAVHYTCLRVDFADRGKGTLVLPQTVGREIIEMVEVITREWERQRRAEIKDKAKAQRRHEAFIKEVTREPRPVRAQPSGTLGKKIEAAANKTALPIDALCVLSQANDPYTAWRRRAAAEWFAALFNRFVPSGTNHLRGFFYLLVTAAVDGVDGKRFVNKNWSALQRASKAARWLELVPFERIIDERNAPPEIYVPGETAISTSINQGAPCSLPADVTDAMPSFCLSGFTGRQTHRIIFYGRAMACALIARRGTATAAAPTAAARISSGA
jgi:hypothetical protein